MQVQILPPQPNTATPSAEIEGNTREIDMNVVEKVEEAVLEGVEKVAEAVAEVADNVAERCAAKAAELKQEDDEDAKAVAARCAAKGAAQGNYSDPVPPAPPVTQPPQPPVDNDHVAEGAEQFSQETIDANKAAAEELAAADDAAEDPAQTEGDVVG